MNPTFERNAKYFFWIAGVLTAGAALPAMVSPAGGLRLTLKLSYFDQSPQVAPIVGHWGAMVVGIGILLFAAASNTQLRRSAAVYQTLEKIYMVAAAIYCLATDTPYARSYVPAIFLDGSLVIGGIWYLLRSRALKQD
jgi:hypothetical protein